MARELARAWRRPRGRVLHKECAACHTNVAVQHARLGHADGRGTDPQAAAGDESRSWWSNWVCFRSAFVRSWLVSSAAGQSRRPTLLRRNGKGVARQLLGGNCGLSGDSCGRPELSRRDAEEALGGDLGRAIPLDGREPERSPGSLRDLAADHSNARTLRACNSDGGSSSSDRGDAASTISWSCTKARRRTGQWPRPVRSWTVKQILQGRYTSQANRRMATPQFRSSPGRPR